jgi:excisionase family DNA binding protein
MRESNKFARDLTVQETCAFFRVTPPTIYSLINNGKLDSYVIGRSRRVTHESVEGLRQTSAVELQNPK